MAYREAVEYIEKMRPDAVGAAGDGLRRAHGGISAAMPTLSGLPGTVEWSSDAATATGSSLVPTWRSSFPRWFGAQIDHVLTRPGAHGAGPEARSVEVVPVPGSDHRALLTRLRL